MSNTNKSICIFCGSRTGNSENTAPKINLLVKLFAQNNFDLVYGGSKKGIMGQVAQIFNLHQRKVIGVVPFKKLEHEKISSNLSEKIHVSSLFERKQKMIELADYFLILPGGLGTLDECFDIIVNNRMGFTKKKVAIFNCLGFYNSLIQQIEVMLAFGFVNKNIWQEVIVEEDPEELYRKLVS